MKKNHLLLVFTFLLVIPYLFSLTIIGIGYNALVLHSAEWFRSMVGSFCGALIMFAIKATIQRPLDLLANETTEPLLKQSLRLFSVRRRRKLLVLNIIIDFFLCYGATILVRDWLTLDQIVGTTIGYVFLVMFISTCLGAYVEYDQLALKPR